MKYADFIAILRTCQVLPKDRFYTLVGLAAASWFGYLAVRLVEALAK